MTDRPILFSAPMVRALLDGRKTQTRRILDLACDEPPAFVRDGVVTAYDENDEAYRWPRTAAVGDRLWVREQHFRFGHWEPVPGVKTKAGRMKWRFVADSTELLFDAPAEYRKGRHHKDPATPAWHKRLARFMFRADSRLTLTVTDVRVQRLLQIIESDAIAEGIERVGAGRYWLGCPGTAPTPSAVKAYSHLWDAINGAGAWAVNPWVVAVTFTVERRNIDAKEAA